MDVLAHLLLPLLCLLAARVPLPRALALAPLGMLPDVDALVGTHRALAHNVFAVALVALAVYAIFRHRVPDPARLAGLAALAYGSHILLDLPYGVSVAWPITLQSLLVRPEILVDMGSSVPVFMPRFFVGAFDGPPAFGAPELLPDPAPPVYEFFGAGSFAVLAVLAIAIAVERPWAKARRVVARPPPRRLRHPLVERERGP